ncbi:Tnks, partial [Symbiodinium pilosum]
MVTTNFGNGPINQASGHITSSCYRKRPTTTTTTSTSGTTGASSSSTSSAASPTTSTSTAARGAVSSSYTETTDAYCSNAMDNGPSIMSRHVDVTAPQVTRRCLGRYGSTGDPMLAVRIVLIVVGLLAAYCLSALTRAKTVPLSSEEGQAIESSIKESLPGYWGTPAVSGSYTVALLARHIQGHANESTDFNAMLYSGEDQVEHFTELLNHTYRARVTQDRPCPKASCSKTPGGCPCVQPDGDPGLPASYVVRRVIRVEDSRMWKRFMRKRDQIRRSRSTGSSTIEKVEPEVCTSGLIKEQPGTFAPVDEGVNEFYLWHGTHVRAALSIAHEDFRIDMAGSNAGTMYGRGCYLAENCTKADEYARDEPHGYYEGVYALLLCRVCMGKFLYTTERYEGAGDRVKSGEFDSTIGDRTKKANTFREFVVYNADQVYPEYVVLYSRRPRAVALETFKFELGGELHAELPVYWQHCHVNPGINAFEAQYSVRATSRVLLQQLAQGCYPGGTGSGSFIKVISARRIEMSSMWNRYVQFKR